MYISSLFSPLQSNSSAVRLLCRRHVHNCVMHSGTDEFRLVTQTASEHSCTLKPTACSPHKACVGKEKPIAAQSSPL